MNHVHFITKRTIFYFWTICLSFQLFWPIIAWTYWIPVVFLKSILTFEITNARINTHWCWKSKLMQKNQNKFLGRVEVVDLYNRNSTCITGANISMRCKKFFFPSSAHPHHLKKSFKPSYLCPHLNCCVRYVSRTFVKSSSIGALQTFTWSLAANIRTTGRDGSFHSTVVR